MNKLQQLAAEATDLGRPGNTHGHVDVTSITNGWWSVTVYVANPFAFHHGDRRDDEVLILNSGTHDFVIITVRGDDLDDVLDRALERVQNAVCDTPCELIA